MSYEQGETADVCEMCRLYLTFTPFAEYVFRQLYPFAEALLVEEGEGLRAVFLHASPAGLHNRGRVLLSLQPDAENSLSVLCAALECSVMFAAMLLSVRCLLYGFRRE